MLKRPETNRSATSRSPSRSLLPRTMNEERKKEEVATIHIVISKAGSIYLAGAREFLQEIRYPTSAGNSNAEVQEEEKRRKKRGKQRREKTKGHERRGEDRAKKKERNGVVHRLVTTMNCFRDNKI